MEREIKFSYIAQHEETGLFMEQIFTLEQIEGSDFIKQWKEKFPRWNIISRRIFIGLKDKNRKEIYEGDIVEETREVGTCVGVVEYSNDRFIPKGLTYNGHYSCYESNWNEIKVIGNIYSNPELLKE